MVPSYIRSKPSHRVRLQSAFSIFILALWTTTAIAGTSGDDRGGKGQLDPISKGDGEKVDGDDKELAKSINGFSKNFRDPYRAKESQQRWKPVLKQIEDLTVDFTKEHSDKSSSSSGKGASFLNQWKLSLDKPMRRFDGFASWEEMLQDWADDIQMYMEKVESETSNSDYPMSTYGIPSAKYRSNISLEETNGARQDISSETADVTSSTENMTTTEEDAVTLTSKDKREPVVLLNPAAAKPGEKVLPHTDIADRSKRILIVTTAALPWMTGTAVNPLLRAAYMTEGREKAGGSVTLMLPWLERREDQESVYSADRAFESPDQQETYIRTWLRETANLEDASRLLKIKWYTAWQNKAENSIYSMGDITALIPAEDVDICILEEPEHLNWYRAPGQPWTEKFKHVVGIIHTNYFVYAQEQPAALIRAPGMRLLCSWMCRAHCHRVIKLSGTLGRFAPEKELVENVHGVRAGFLDSGKELRNRLKNPSEETLAIFGPNADPSVYFIGKMLWSKGLGSLMELLKYAEESAGIRIKVDMYGGGPDKEAASSKAKSLELDMPFHGPIDHAELAFTHKVFINPSTSEVLCTTVSEALAMGKFVVLPSHPSNDFFAQFPNCLTYNNKEEFVGNLYYALTHAPEPLSEEYAYALSWQAATERLEAAGCIPVAEHESFEQARRAKAEGIEISLPPIIESEKGRKMVATTIGETRDRYRQFRSRLSQEVRQSNVLPKPLKNLLMSELDKRLDLDIESILESPKLRLKLSPAELDKQLLELYNFISESPTGDPLRVLGGGRDVAFQNLYIKRHAWRRKAIKQKGEKSSDPFGLVKDMRGDETDSEARTVSQWVKKALSANLTKSNVSSNDTSRKRVTSSGQEDDSKMTMSISHSFAKTSTTKTWPRVPSPAKAGAFCPVRNSQATFSILI